MNSANALRRLELTHLKISYVFLICSLLTTVGVAESLVLTSSLTWLSSNTFSARFSKGGCFSSCVPRIFDLGRSDTKRLLLTGRSPAALHRQASPSLNLNAVELVTTRIISWIGELGKHLMPALFKPDDVAAAWKSLPSVVSWFQPRFFMQGSKRETLWETVLDDGRTLCGNITLIPRRMRAGRPRAEDQVRVPAPPAPPATACCAERRPVSRPLRSAAAPLSTVSSAPSIA